MGARSSNPPVTGDVYVYFQGGSKASATVSGQIPGAVSGEVARLYAQQFPFTSAPAPVATLALQPAGPTAGYSFQVTPALATRYQVRLFRSSTATTPLASSATTTVYVIPDVTGTPVTNCSNGVCQVTWTTTVTVPAGALATEVAKQWYGYFGYTLAPSGHPPPPQTLQLGAGDAQVSRPQPISATEFSFTATFMYQAGADASTNWAQVCDKDTEAEDGLGLPGPHDCGTATIPTSPGYLG